MLGTNYVPVCIPVEFFIIIIQQGASVCKIVLVKKRALFCDVNRYDPMNQKKKTIDMVLLLGGVRAVGEKPSQELRAG